MDWLILIALLALVFYRFRKSLHFEFPILYFKTERMVERVWKVGRKRKKLISAIGDIALLVSLIVIPLAFFFVAKSAYDVMTIPTMKSPIAPVIPGVRLPGSDVFIPLWHGLISIAVLGSVHELSHGLMAAAQGTKPKSILVIFLAVLTSFGVELDNEDVKKLSLREQLRIFSAGSFANFVTAALFVGIFLGFATVTSSILEPVAMEIVEIEAESPADGVLMEGDILLAMNESRTTDFAAFINISRQLKPNSTLLVETERGNFTLNTTYFPEEPQRGKIGIISTPKFDSAAEPFVPAILWFSQLFNWLFGLNLGVGFLNLLPLPPFDGGRMVALISEKYSKNGKIAKSVYLFTLLFLLINIFGGFFKGL